VIARSSAEAPVGLSIRPYAGESDIPAIVGVINAEWEHDRVIGRVTVEEKQAQYRHASDGFDARRGLARALIARALVVLRDRGMIGAILEVDSANDTGALGLYESAGFRVEHRSSSWRKPMGTQPSVQ
jgi:GNAT superfamily N-acetyltransferase